MGARGSLRQNGRQKSLVCDRDSVGKGREFVSHSTSGRWARNEWPEGHLLARGPGMGPKAGWRLRREMLRNALRPWTAVVRLTRWRCPGMARLPNRTASRTWFCRALRQFQQGHSARPGCTGGTTSRWRPFSHQERQNCTVVPFWDAAVPALVPQCKKFSRTFHKRKL